MLGTTIFFKKIKINQSNFGCVFSYWKYVSTISNLCYLKAEEFFSSSVFKIPVVQKDLGQGQSKFEYKLFDEMLHKTVKLYIQLLIDFILIFF